MTKAQLFAAHRVKLDGEEDGYFCPECSETKNTSMVNKQLTYNSKDKSTIHQGKRQHYPLRFLKSAFNMSIPPASPECLLDLNQCEIAIISPASVCMTIHNRTSDTDRPQSRSTGHACIMPFDYAGQIKTITDILPRLPNETNI